MGIQYIFNPFTGNLDAINTGGSGSGDITGPVSSTDKAIVRWDGITGEVIQDSPGTYVQDGGAIESSGFLTDRSITTLVVIPDSYSWIAPSLELELTGSVELEPNGELIII